MPQGWTVVPEQSGWTRVDEEPRMMAAHDAPRPSSAFDMINPPENQKRPTLSEVAGKVPEAAMDVALGEVGGQVVGRGLKLAARGLYRAGALPLVNMGKYGIGNLIGRGLDDAVPVTKAGEMKAGRLKVAAQANKAAAVASADQTASFRTQGIADDALSRVKGDADKLRRAGLGDPTEANQIRAGRMVAENPPGLKPSELEAIKGTLDDTLGPAYKKQRMKELISPDERMSMAISHAAGDAQSTVIPGYKALNREVMDSEGLRRMIQRRLMGNQGLENALTMAAGPAAIPARIAMLPGVASTMGIAAHKAAPTLEAATRAALLAFLASEQHK